MSNELSYYEVLGAEPDVSRDELREAYRSRVTELRADDYKGSAEERRELVAGVNRAWNVLSDPFQRKRYDDQLRATGDHPAEAGDGDGEAPAAPPARTTRRGRAAIGSATPPTPPTLPGGLRLAEPRDRGFAMLIDLAVLAAIVFLVPLAARPVINRTYPHEVKRLNALIDREDAANRRADRADERTTKADATIAVSKRQQDAAGLAAAEQRAAGARADARAARHDAKRAHDDARRVQRDLAPAQYATLGASALVALACLAVPTAIAGQTLGMRFRGIGVARADGERVGWGGALTRFALPVLLAAALLFSLPGLLLGLGSVLWWLRDAKRQGFHDKLARTIVVESAGEKA